MSKTYIPLNKPSRDLLLDLINVTNLINPPLTFEKVALDAPALLPPNLSTLFDSNTKVIVKDVNSEGYLNSRLIYYDRLDLNILFQNEIVKVDTDFLDEFEALTAFNELYDLAIDPSELEYIRQVDVRTVEIAIGNSYAYLPGGTITIVADTELTRLEDYSDRVWYYVNYVLPVKVYTVEPS